ncbi:MAG: magnesium/cobalt transporter CorA [Gammaproteobacteria bacterium]|nr:magnesium/cobalt transporter CorA [Gammaproteobacteria bacterium]
MSYFQRRYHRPGTAPGTLVDRTDAPPARLHLFDYDENELHEVEDISLEDCRHYFDSPQVTWLHCQGAASTAMLRELGEAYQLHPLAMEDVINEGQRSKVDVYDDRQVFMVLNLPLIRDDELVIEQVSLFLGPTYVVSFHNGPNDIMDPIRQRIRGPIGRFRRSQADYLLYALADLVIDQAFPLLEEYGEALDELEEKVLQDPERNTLDLIHFVKRELVLIRKTLWPQREAINQLVRDEHPLVNDSTKLYFRDCYDHSIQLIELVESYREMTSSLMDVYLSSLSNRMNDVMKVLTIIATIFIPLSFFTGLYGMNFNTEHRWNMPELDFAYGYPLLLLFLACIAGGMLYFFRKKKWL